MDCLLQVHPIVLFGACMFVSGGSVDSVGGMTFWALLRTPVFKKVFQLKV